MTDFSRSQNIYYQAFGQNDSTTQQNIAQVDIPLQYPLLQKTNDYNLGIVKARVDLSTIPLTRRNIPLNTYGVQLKAPSGQMSDIFYASQVGAKNSDFLYNVDSTGFFKKFNYTSSTGQVQSPPVSSFQLGNGVQSVYQIAVDQQENIYVACNTNGSAVFDKIFKYNSGGDFIQQLSFTNIKALAINFTSQIFVAEADHIAVFDGLNNLAVVTDILNDFAGNPLADVRLVCSDFQTLVGHGANNFTLYDSQYQAISDFTKAEITSLQNASSMLGLQGGNSFVVLDDTFGDIEYPLWGRNLASPFLIENCFSENQVMPSTPPTGSFFQCSPAYSVYNSIENVYTLTTDGTLQKYLYNGSQSLATFAETINTGFPKTWLTSEPTNYGVMASNFTVKDFSGYNLNPAILNYQVVNTNFEISPSVGIGNFCYDYDTYKLLAVGLDFNLYQTFGAYFPRQIVFDGQAQGSSFYNTETQDISNTDVITLNAGGFSYISALDGKMRVVDNTNQVKVYGMPNYIAEANVTLANHFPNGEVQVNSACVGLPGTFIILAGNNSGFSSFIYIYNETTGALLDTINLVVNIGDLPVEDGMISFHQPTGFPATLMVTSGQPQINSTLRNFTLTASPFTHTLAFNYVAPQSGLGFFGCCFIGDRFFISQGVGSPTDLIEVLFSNLNYTVITGASPALASGLVFDRKCNIAGNFLLSEIYAKTSTALNLYNIDNATYLLNNAIPLILDSPLTNFICPIQDLAGIWSFVAVSTTDIGAGACHSVAKPQDTDKILIVRNSVFDVYEGTLTGNVVSSMAVPESLQGVNYTVISVLNGATADDILLVARCFSLSTQTLLNSYSFFLNDEVQSIARNNVENQYIIQKVGPDDVESYYFSNSLVLQHQNDFPNDAYAIFTKNGLNLEAGNIDIYDYDVLIASLNQALLLAYQQLGNPYAERPILSLNYSTGLCTISYSSDYPSTTGSIFFNLPLLQLIYFANVQTNNTAPFQLLLPDSSTSLIQPAQTISSFNQLDKILFISNAMSVQGLFEGNNNQNNIIADVDIPNESVLNIGEVLFFQTNFVNAVQLASNLPLNRIQLQIWYQYKDGTKNNVLLNPGQSFSVKMIFIQK